MCFEESEIHQVVYLRLLLQGKLPLTHNQPLLTRKTRSVPAILSVREAAVLGWFIPGQEAGRFVSGEKTGELHGWRT